MDMVVTREKKQNKGRREKIEIKKIEKKNDLSTAFTKRRDGLFTKAAELSVLCGAEIAILVFSHDKRVFTFGHPNADAIVDHYVTGKTSPENMKITRVVQKNSQFYTEAPHQLEEEKKRGKMILQSKATTNNERFWWDLPIEGMSLEELQEYVASLEKLKNNGMTKI